MTELMSRFDGALADIFGQPIVQLGLKAVGLYLVVLWLAAAVWAYRDMRNRSEMELAAYLAAALIVGFTPLFFPLAIVVYRIVRPPETLAEAWERRLSGSALEAQAEALQGCCTCGRRIDAEWLICPDCGTKLHRLCAECGRLIELDWLLCAWCGHELERRAASPLEGPTPQPAPLGRPLAPVGIEVSTTSAPMSALPSSPGPRGGAERAASGAGAR
jgi:hypothetical protein